MDRAAKIKKTRAALNKLHKKPELTGRALSDADLEKMLSLERTLDDLLPDMSDDFDDSIAGYDLTTGEPIYR